MEQKTNILFTQDQLLKRFKELGKQISEDYKDKDLHVICLLSGGVYFFCSLTQFITVPMSCDFMKSSSYGTNRVSSGRVYIMKDIDMNIENKDVLIIDDICDSGRTFSYITKMLENRNPRSIKTCCMLDKVNSREVDFKCDYVGFEIPNYFVYGYGLDLEYKCRNLPYICKVDTDEESK